MPSSSACIRSSTIKWAKTRPSCGKSAADPKDKGVAMDRERHPKGLYVLFFTEMWERFSFYLILGILLQYLTDHEKGGMGMSGGDGTVIVGSYQALAYFTPFIGGLIADRLLGCRRMIVMGGLMMMLGHLVLA